MCLRSRINDKYHNNNILDYVIIHELSHMMLDEMTGHGIEFKRMFKYLLDFCIKNKYYKKIDFKNHPKEYCGIHIK
tara:strand:+ start:589 stop:816 length:228 start_codon:yes stop_codon:yes gene_type:complete